MDDVAAACGITKLIVYRHFESKEELYRAVLEQVIHRLGEELESGLSQPTSSGLGARTLITVAREEPAAFTLLWRHAAREPQFAAYAAELRGVSVAVAARLSHLESGDAVIDSWRAEALFSFLIESTLAWLEHGDPERDDEFVEQLTLGLRAMRIAWSPTAAVR